MSRIVLRDLESNTVLDSAALTGVVGGKRKLAKFGAVAPNSVHGDDGDYREEDTLSILEYQSFLSFSI